MMSGPLAELATTPPQYLAFRQTRLETQGIAEG